MKTPEGALFNCIRPKVARISPQSSRHYSLGHAALPLPVNDIGARVSLN